jgi:hypothetical protein
LTFFTYTLKLRLFNISPPDYLPASRALAVTDFTELTSTSTAIDYRLGTTVGKRQPAKNAYEIKRFTDPLGKDTHDNPFAVGRVNSWEALGQQVT